MAANVERRIALGKTERGPCQRITYRKNIGGEISIWVALSAAADKAKGQNRNYPGAARTRGTRWGLVTPNNRGSTGPHNSHIFGGAPAAALYVPVFPLPRQLPCLVVVAAALPLPPRCHPPSFAVAVLLQSRAPSLRGRRRGRRHSRPPAGPRPRAFRAGRAIRAPKQRTRRTVPSSKNSG